MTYFSSRPTSIGDHSYMQAVGTAPENRLLFRDKLRHDHGMWMIGHRFKRAFPPWWSMRVPWKAMEVSWPLVIRLRPLDRLLGAVLTGCILLGVLRSRSRSSSS